VDLHDDPAPRGDEDPVRAFLRARGSPDHVVRGGLEGLVAEWERVAVALEHGYPLDTLDDYLNDMDLRALIEEVLASLAQPPALASRINAADARARAQLVQADGCLWGEGLAARNDWDYEDDWWYFMRPARPGPGLRGDLGLEEDPL
jgi:hypothetical protein